MAASVDSSSDDPKETLIRASLRSSQLFGDLSRDDLADVASVSALKSYRKGDYLFHEGDVAEGLFLVQSGAINVHRVTAGGKEQVIHVFRPFDVFAEIVLTTNETYPADAVALENSQVILIRKNAFRELVMRKPELALKMLTSMSVHLKHLVQMIEDMKYKDIESRLANWLLRHCPGTGDAKSPPTVRLDTSKKVLAGQLGVSSETLSRAFAKFRERELVSVDGAEITLLDCKGLRRHTEH